MTLWQTYSPPLQTPQVKDLLDKISQATDDQLPEVLNNVLEWCWPRGDLHYWTQTLNRFDIILADTIQEYAIDKVQTKPFEPARKDLIASILRFSRLLIENCTNRKLYNSYDVSSRLSHSLRIALLTRLNTTLADISSALSTHSDSMNSSWLKMVIFSKPPCACFSALPSSTAVRPAANPSFPSPCLASRLWHSHGHPRINHMAWPSWSSPTHIFLKTCSDFAFNFTTGQSRRPHSSQQRPNVHRPMPTPVPAGLSTQRPSAHLRLPVATALDVRFPKALHQLQAA